MWEAIMGSTKRKVILIGIIAVLVAIAVVMFINNSGELSGTWVHERAARNDSEFAPTIQFSGNRFTTTHYEGHIITTQRPVMNIGFAFGRTPWSVHGNATQTSVQAPELEPGRIVGVPVDGGAYTRGAYRITQRGTYSVTDGRLELLFSDGTIQTFNIQRSENTLDIGGQRFIRR